jgi:hypothetical protein
LLFLGWSYCRAWLSTSTLRVLNIINHLACVQLFIVDEADEVVGGKRSELMQLKK